MSVKIKNAQAADLLQVLTDVSRMKKMPLKFCIARNIKMLQEPVQEYFDKKDELFKAAVKIDAESNAVVIESLRDEYSNDGDRVPYNAFEYNSEEAKKDFLKKLTELNSAEIDVEFHKESANREIKVSMEDGTYSDATIAQVLEDPNNDITPSLITVFMQYFLEIE